MNDGLGFDLQYLLEENTLLCRHLGRLAASRFASSSEEAFALVADLLRCLYCKVFVAPEVEMSLSLPPILDELWHEAILNTDWYQRLSKCLGRFPRHTTVTAGDSEKAKRVRINRTRGIYKALFEREPEGAWWPIQEIKQEPDDRAEQEQEQEQEQSQPAHKRAKPEDEVIRIVVVNMSDDWSELIIRCKLSTLVAKVQNAYARSLGIRGDDFYLTDYDFK